MANPGGNRMQRLFRAEQERSLVQEIRRRIATDRELREEHQVRAEIGGTRGEIKNLAGISRKVASRRVNLRKGNLHRGVFDDLLPVYCGSARSFALRVAAQLIGLSWLLPAV